MAAHNLVDSRAGKGLSLNRRPAIARTNVAMLLFENVFENGIFKMSAILFSPEYDNTAMCCTKLPRFPHSDHYLIIIICSIFNLGAEQTLKHYVYIIYNGYQLSNFFPVWAITCHKAVCGSIRAHPMDTLLTTIAWIMQLGYQSPM